MFVYHYAVREFLAYVLDEQRFGEIRNVDTCFDINSKVTRFYGFESDESSGCIDDLCRYCAIMGLLVFQRSKRNASTAQVTNVELDANGNPLHCICQVKFEGVRMAHSIFKVESVVTSSYPLAHYILSTGRYIDDGL